MRLHNTILPLTVTTLLGLTSLSSAQSAQDAQPLDIASITARAIAAQASQVMFDHPSAGVIHAKGATWKGSFSADGATYIPFLGEDAPRNFPLSFRLEGATVGGDALLLDAKPTVRREGDRIVIDHGSILEVYDVEPNSIEQSFILPKRSKRGEIRVKMAVASELDGYKDAREHRFVNEHGGVTYGEAFAFDGGGQRVDATTRLADGSIELTVPDAFPIDAGDDGRLVIDPVLTTISPIASQIGARNADVAFEKDVDGGGVYVIVYETGFSNTDHDIHAIEVRKADGAIQNLGAIDISDDDTRVPSVAGNDAVDTFLVAYEWKAEGQNRTHIASRTREAGTTSIGQRRLLSSLNGNASYFAPEVGGENAPIFSQWGVVWRRTDFGISTIQGRSVISTGAPFGQTISLSAAGNISDSEPTISEGDGSLVGDSTFNFAYTRRNGATDRDVYVGQLELSSSGVQIVETARSLGQLGDFHSPSVSNLSPTTFGPGQKNVYIVAVQADAPTTGDDQISAYVMAGDQVLSLNSLSLMENGVFTGDHSSPSVAVTGSGFVFTYEANEETFMASAFLTRYGDQLNLALAERRQVIQGRDVTGVRYRNPELVSDWESGLLTSKGAFIASDSSLSNGSFHTVKAGHIAQYSGTGAVGTQYCRGQFNSTLTTGFLSIFGGQSATTTKVLTAVDLPVGQFAMIVTSRQAGFTSMPGGSQGNLCLGGGIGRMLDNVSLVLPSGTALFLLDPTEISTPNAIVAAQPGETWYFQVWHRDVVQGNQTSNFTNGVRIEFQ